MAIYFNIPPEHWPPVVGCDLETTGLNPHSDHIISIAFSDGTDTWIFLHTFGFVGVREVLTDPSVTKVFHHAKFDIKFIKKHLGVDVFPLYCTMLAEQVHLGGRPDPVSLSDVVARRVGVVLPKEERKTFVNHPGVQKRRLTAQQIEYIDRDVRYLLEVRLEQLRDLRQAGIYPVAQTEFDCIPAFADIELSGFTLDIPLWYQHLKWYEDHIRTVTDEMRNMVGSRGIDVTRLKKGVPYVQHINAEDINFNSHSQLKETIAQCFGTVLPDTRAETLQDVANGYMKATNEAVQFTQLVTKLRGWEKRAGFDYPKFVDPVTNKVHPNIHQIGAGTGRVSISDPGLHQVPRPIPKKPGEDEEPNLRHVWTADDPDFVILRADYSQQEPRILAHVSGDTAMLEACNAADVYIEFAKHLYGHPVAKDSEERQITKAFVLAVGYGAGPYRLHKASNRPLEDCEHIRDMILDRFPQMVEYANRTEQFFRQNGFVMTVTGRRRYLGSAAQASFRYSQAVNTVVQGTAADMFKLALSQLHSALTELKKCGKIHTNTRVWHVVHDEIDVHCHKDDVALVKPLVSRIMEDAGAVLCPSVRHIAEVKEGPTWDK